MQNILTPAQVTALQGEPEEPPDWFVEIIHRLLHRRYQNGMALMFYSEIHQCIHRLNRPLPPENRYVVSEDDITKWCMSRCWLAAGWKVMARCSCESTDEYHLVFASNVNDEWRQKLNPNNLS